MVVRSYLLCNFVTRLENQALLLSINPAMDGFLVGCRGTVAANIEAGHAAHEKVVKKRLLSARNLIYISIGVWSSLQCKSFTIIYT